MIVLLLHLHLVTHAVVAWINPLSVTTTRGHGVSRRSQIQIIHNNCLAQNHHLPKCRLQRNDFNNDEDEDDDDDVPEIDIANFNPPKNMVSFGLNRGRSSPAQRKAMGTSGSSTTSVHVCTNCGCETVKWHGKCPTCQEWNTLQEFSVQRERKTSMSSRLRPIFSTNGKPTSSWVSSSSGINRQDDFDFGGRLTGSYNMDMFPNQPIRITDVFGKDKQGASNLRNQRIPIPDDEELSTVLGGGIMKGSLCLLGGVRYYYILYKVL